MNSVSKFKKNPKALCYNHGLIAVKKGSTDCGPIKDSKAGKFIHLQRPMTTNGNPAYCLQITKADKSDISSNL